jgi:RNA polymerase sigma-70 factor (ECF subfamily)
MLLDPHLDVVLQKMQFHLPAPLSDQRFPLRGRDMSWKRHHMADESSFQALLKCVRSGDDAAAAELLRRYEPVLRRIIQVRLLNARLRGRVDTSDICQSVLASFFVRVALGQYELNSAEDLLKLLATMVRNKVIDKARRRELEGDVDRRVPVAELPENALAASQGSPSQQVALRELVGEARRRLSPEERQLLELRQEGLAWNDIAARVGGSPEALRKRLSRAVDLVAQELGLDEDNP